LAASMISLISRLGVNMVNRCFMLNISRVHDCGTVLAAVFPARARSSPAAVPGCARPRGRDARRVRRR
jgi:hypothetical protein